MPAKTKTKKKSIKRSSSSLIRAKKTTIKKSSKIAKRKVRVKKKSEVKEENAIILKGKRGKSIVNILTPYRGRSRLMAFSRKMGISLLVFIIFVLIVSYGVYRYDEDGSIFGYKTEELHGTSTGQVITVLNEEELKEFILREPKIAEKEEIKDVVRKIEADTAPVDIGNDSIVKQGQYQAVYLINGEMYIGKLTFSDSPEIAVLEDIFYLKFVDRGRPPVIGTGSKVPSGRQDAILIKRGEELHAPRDIMYIFKKNILFYEDLRDNSKVIQSIRGYHKTRK